MSLKIKDATGVVRNIKRLSIKDSGGAVHLLQQLSLQDQAGTLRPIFSAMTAEASPDSVSGDALSSIPITVYAGPVGCTPTGGIAPYTYHWAVVNIISGDWSATSPNTTNTLFQCNFVAPGADYNATFHCTVTDSLGTIAVSNLVAANAVNSGP